MRHGENTLDNLFEIYTRIQLEDAVPSIVMPFVDLAAVITADWYTNLNPDSKFVPTDEQFAVKEGRIAYTLAWSFEQHGEVTPGDRMTGAFQRMVFDASRNIVVTNAKTEGMAWHRDALPDACEFCRLLTVDPHAYRGKYVDMPSHNHDCRCLAVVSRGANVYDPPSYVEEWRREVEANKTGNLTETLAGMGESHV